jgi:multimeric flavodoxin WrbA
MRVLTILGGPNKHGNSAQVLGWVEDELRSKGHEIDRVNVVDYKIAGCRSCYACQANPDEPGCAQEDDGKRILERMTDSDVIVLTSPLFGWGFTGQVKSLIDRWFCFVTGGGPDKRRSLVKGKRFGLIVTASGPIERNMDLIRESFKRIVNWLTADHAGELLVPFCTAPEAMGPDIRDQAIEFANRVTGEVGK